jgi:hypothetical protein
MGLTPFSTDRGCFVSHVFFAISVWIAFSNRIFHTEIAKVAKTDLGIGCPFAPYLFPFLCVLCDLRVDRLF